MIATQELIAAALALAALAERNTDDRDEWQHAIDSVREACARAMVQPAAPDIAEVRPGMEGWKEAAIAWEVCASIHREYAKKKDPFFTTRQSDFVKHAEATRAKALTPEPDMAERDALIHDNERSIHGDAHEAVGYARGKLEAVPSGYWLAPVEPTPEMKSAGLHVEVGENNHVLTWTEVAAIYREMRDAALRGEVKP